MTRILLISYSQSGEAARVADVLAEGFTSPFVELTTDRLRPLVDYSFSWKRLGAFFGILPECHYGPLPPLAPLALDPRTRYDLVVLIYQVWFLAPSLPVQSFLRSDAARALRDTKVLTVSISRSMWQSASETMKGLLREAGVRHVDNVVLTHQGPPWATFVTTPRALLFGKKEGFWRVFPPAGLGPDEMGRLRRFSETILSRTDTLLGSENAPLLSGQGAVRVETRYLLAERLGWHCFRFWGRLIKGLERWGGTARRVGVYLFVAFLLPGILIGIPLTMILRVLLFPLFHRWIAAYTTQLQEPSGP